MLMKNLFLFLSSLFLSFQISAQSFTKVTTGDFVNSGPSLSTNWGDINQDGWNDLYKSSPTTGTTLYVNIGDNTFTKIIPILLHIKRTSIIHLRRQVPSVWKYMIKRGLSTFYCKTYISRWGSISTPGMRLAGHQVFTM